MSTIVIDTIQGKTTAGSINVRGEGSNNTNLQQGLAKAWIAHEADGTPSAYDSFNNSSLTDLSTGLYKYNFTNNFAVAKGYTNVGCMGHYADHLVYIKQINPHNSNDILTSSFEAAAMYVGTTNPNHDFGVYDYNYVTHTANGDLA